MKEFTTTEYDAYLGLLQLLKYQRSMEIQNRRLIQENEQLQQKIEVKGREGS